MRPLQFTGHIHHLLQTGCYQSAQTDDIHILLLRLTHNLFSGHHHTHIDNLIAVAGHHHTHNVLTDIVHIALHRCQQHLSRTLATFGLLSLNIRLQDTHRLLHRTGSLHHLRQKHLSFSKQLTHGIHTRHQRSFDDIHCMGIFLQCFLQIFLQILTDALYQRLCQTLLNRGAISRSILITRITLSIRITLILLRFQKLIGQLYQPL